MTKELQACNLRNALPKECNKSCDSKVRKERKRGEKRKKSIRTDSVSSSAVFVCEGVNWYRIKLGGLGLHIHHFCVQINLTPPTTTLWSPLPPPFLYISSLHSCTVCKHVRAGVPPFPTGCTESCYWETVKVWEFNSVLKFLTRSKRRKGEKTTYWLMGLSRCVFIWTQCTKTPRSRECRTWKQNPGFWFVGQCLAALWLVNW